MAIDYRDPSFENQLADWGGGPLGNEIPYWTAVTSSPPSYWWPSDDSAGPADTYYVQPSAATSELALQTISTDLPRTGTKSLKFASDGLGSVSNNNIYIVNQTMTGGNGPTFRSFYTKLVTGGEVVDIAFWVRSSSAPSSPETFISAEFYNSDGSFNADFGGVVTNGTSWNAADWTQVSTTLTAPANAFYMLVYFSVSSTSVQNIYIDDFAIETISLFVTKRGFRFPYQRWTT